MGRKVPTRMLVDLRHVYKRPKEEDRTQAHRYLRGIYESSPTQFMAMMQKAEDAYRAKAKADIEGKDKPQAVDVGSAKCIELAENLIKELTGGG